MSTGRAVEGDDTAYMFAEFLEFFGEEEGFTTSGEVVEPTAAPAAQSPAPSQDFDF